MIMNVLLINTLTYIILSYPDKKINKVAKERQINIIFAVTRYEELYENLHKQVETSSYGLLNDGSSNIVELVREEYQVSPTRNVMAHFMVRCFPL